MTRINVVPPTELCDQHLLAEHRELTRIPHMIYKGRVKTTAIPSKYTVQTADNPKGGEGHVRFFYDKLKYLFERYVEINHECSCRGFNVTDIWSEEEERHFRGTNLWNDYEPTEEAIFLNRKRILERMPNDARWAWPSVRPQWALEPQQYHLPFTQWEEDRIRRLSRDDANSRTRTNFRSYYRRPEIAVAE